MVGRGPVGRGPSEVDVTIGKWPKRFRGSKVSCAYDRLAQISFFFLDCLGFDDLRDQIKENGECEKGITK